MLSGAKHLFWITDSQGAFKILHCVQNDMNFFYPWRITKMPPSGNHGSIRDCLSELGISNIPIPVRTVESPQESEHGIAG